MLESSQPQQSVGQFAQSAAVTRSLALAAAVGWAARVWAALWRPARWVALLLLSVALTLVFGEPDGDRDVLAQTTSWISTFDGAPSSPQPYNPSTWDVLVHSRDTSTWKQLEGMEAHHGANCAGAPASHPISQYNDAVFLCNNHVMTAINASGYGLVMLTPNQLVDLSQGEVVIRFDMTTFRSSLRDWVSVWLSPMEDHVPLPLPEWYPDLAGEPRRAINIEMGAFNGETTFSANIIKNHNAERLPGQWWLGYESFLTTSAVRRDPFELRISRTSLKFGMPTYNQWWVDTTFPDLGWDRAVLQLGHHSYNPRKDCHTSSCPPNTWHWDNVSISRAIPFTMLKGDLPWVDRTSRPYVQFNPAAPANAYLRFVGIGSNLQVSFDDGASWQNAQMKPIEKNLEEAFKPYWMPVPQGTTRVHFRGDGWWGGDWMVRNPSIWGQSSDGTPPAPTATPVSNCTVRPQTTVQTQALGGGRLQVTIGAGRPSSAPNNLLRRIQITPFANARVEILGQTIGAGGGSVSPNPPAPSVTFTVVRQAAGPITVPLAITDDCGDWNTFVGGGANAF